MRAGRPSSPVSKRRTSARPNVPVPPVMSIRLFASGSMSSVPFVVRCGIGRHVADHLRPTGRYESGQGPESSGIEAPVASDFGIRLALDDVPIRNCQHPQDVVLWRRLAHIAITLAV